MHPAAVGAFRARHIKSATIIADGWTQAKNLFGAVTIVTLLTFVTSPLTGSVGSLADSLELAANSTFDDLSRWQRASFFPRVR